MRTPLKVLFAGSPDVGKSTLIGRILLRTGSVFQDQHQGDLAHYTDGLADEQKKGMTIDVSYRTIHLESGHRCILIDTPGHDDLMTNFLGALSSCDLVIYLQDNPNLNPSWHFRIARSLGKPIHTVLTKSNVLQSDFFDFVIDSVNDTGVSELLAQLQSYAELEGGDRLRRLITNGY